MNTILSFTGHRPKYLPGQYSDRTTRALATTVEGILQKHQPSKILTGMALGLDQVAATISAQLDIPFVAVIPFEGQERLWPSASQQRYHQLLGCAEEVVIVSNGGYSVEKMQLRNQWLVNNSDTLAALWNGEVRSGTFNCIRYAKQKQLSINNYWDYFMANYQQGI